MQIPLRIRYHQCDPSDALNVRIEEKTSELERLFGRIIGCAVTVEGPSGHHRRGRGAHYRVRIELSVPRGPLVVGRDPGDAFTHEDPFLAVDDAFRAISRRLEDHARKLRGDVKAHVGPTHAIVARLDAGNGFGFLQDAGGREIYFHRNSVLGDAFDSLSPGMEVRFHEEEGDEGPQASSVAPIGSNGHHESVP